MPGFPLESEVETTWRKKKKKKGKQAKIQML